MRAVVSFKHKMILIAGTGYTGEIKKGIFTILNYILPHEKNVLSMHCSANMGERRYCYFLWIERYRQNNTKRRPQP